MVDWSKVITGELLTRLEDGTEGEVAAVEELKAVRAFVAAVAYTCGVHAGQEGAPLTIAEALEVTSELERRAIERAGQWPRGVGKPLSQGLALLAAAARAAVSTGRGRWRRA